VTAFSDLLSSQSGRYMDVLHLEVEVPALETSLTVQLFSRDDDGEWSCEEFDNCPASLVWTAAALAIAEGGGEGCGTRFWAKRRNLGSWPGPLSPDTPFSSVFEDAFYPLTLHGVLRQRGGGLNALGRATVAALLNAQSPDVDYDLIPSEVVDLFNGVYPTNKATYNNLESMFQGFNAQVCPLGQTRRIRRR
jgi:hypothetical protein